MTLPLQLNDPSLSLDCQCLSALALTISPFLSLSPRVRVQLRKDMEQREAENTRLANRIVSLQRELDYLKNRLDHATESTATRQEIEELKLKHQYELSLAKRTQWVRDLPSAHLMQC